MHTSSLVRVTRPDAIKLTHLVQRLAPTVGEQADLLQEVLDLAQIVPSESIPPEVATLNSQIVIEDCGRREALSITLVLPQHADATAGRISVVSPMGRALLGRAVGEVIDVQLPNGTTRRVELKAIPYQPEANGIHETA